MNKFILYASLFVINCIFLHNCVAEQTAGAVAKKLLAMDIRSLGPVQQTKIIRRRTLLVQTLFTVEGSYGASRIISPDFANKLQNPESSVSDNEIFDLY